MTVDERRAYRAAHRAAMNAAALRYYHRNKDAINAKKRATRLRKRGP